MIYAIWESYNQGNKMAVRTSWLTRIPAFLEKAIQVILEEDGITISRRTEHRYYWTQLHINPAWMLLIKLDQVGTVKCNSHSLSVGI